jgi:hypothetical protein
LKAQIFYEDRDEKIVRPKSILQETLNPRNILRRRLEYFRDTPGTETLVMIEGLPKRISLGRITYFVRLVLKEAKFDWAYEWINRAGGGEQFEPNAFPITTVYRERFIDFKLIR